MKHKIIKKIIIIILILTIIIPFSKKQTNDFNLLEKKNFRAKGIVEKKYKRLHFISS